MMPQLLAHLFGYYIFQSDWMAQNKTKRSCPAFVHALLYSLCFVPLLWSAGFTIYEHKGMTGDNCSAYVDDSTGQESACVSWHKSNGGYLPSIAHPHVRDHVSGDIVRLPAVEWPGYFRWLPWLVIFGTHFLIDRFRLARYVVWAKNWMGPRELWAHVNIGREERWIKQGEVTMVNEEFMHWQRLPLSACSTGYPPSTPIWLSTWLLIVADNTCHLLLNFLALRYL